jgi:hypothetical protein
MPIAGPSYCPDRRPLSGEGVGAGNAHEGEFEMFSHIMIGSNDIARSKKFYDALFCRSGGSTWC